MYIHYRKNLPDYFEQEINLALKTFHGVHEDDVPKAFNSALSKSEDRMPLIKNIARQWRESQQDTLLKTETCGECNNGFVTDYAHIKKSDGTVYKKPVQCRCECGIGQALPSNILTIRKGQRLVMRGV